MKKIYLIRHGETPWSLSGQHTSYTDLSLTEHGRKEALSLQKNLPDFDHVFISPLKRARETAEILKLKGSTIQELVEWNYGIYEGKTTHEIQKKSPEWNIFSHGAPFGESPHEVQERAKKVLNLLDSLEGTIAIVSSGHFSRVLIATYLDQPCTLGMHVLISTASFSILSEDRGIKVIEALNLKL